MTSQLTIEDVNSIDIRWLNKNGYLKHCGNGSLSWSSYGQKNGSIGYRMADDRMTLIYTGGETSYHYDVMFDKTPCHLGGYRKWFKCPRCRLRCAVLYLTNYRFFCRKCTSLPYLSTLQTDIDRMIEQKHKLGYRTFEYYDGHGYWKKKHMQQKTFEKLRHRYDDLDQRIDDFIYSCICKLRL